MTNEELLSVAEIVDRLVTRFHNDHEAKMVEHRAAFGVRTEADAKIIAALRAEVELANGECNVLRALTVDTAKYKANSDLFYNEQKRRMDAEKERDALRAEVAALQERLRASIPRGDFAQLELAALKSQTPKHPVAIGGWLRRKDSGYDDAPHGYKASVLGIQSFGMDYTYTVIDQSGNRVPWSSAYCEPCDPPEATHDTEAGKAAAQAAVKSEPDEIKVGDLVEVISRSFSTFATIGTRGKAIIIHGLAGYVDLDNSMRACIKDVRKVTT